jgi:hypothetical protein
MDALTGAALRALPGIVAQAAPAPGSDTGTILIGVGAILATLTPIAVALVSRARREKNGDADTGLAEDRKRHVRYLQERVDQLEAELSTCRAEAEVERKRLVAEGKVQLVHIGDLEARLVRTKADLAQAREDLARALAGQDRRKT